MLHVTSYTAIWICCHTERYDVNWIFLTRYQVILLLMLILKKTRATLGLPISRILGEIEPGPLQQLYIQGHWLLPSFCPGRLEQDLALEPCLLQKTQFWRRLGQLWASWSSQILMIFGEIAAALGAHLEQCQLILWSALSRSSRIFQPWMVTMVLTFLLCWMICQCHRGEK